ncbi:hypothetical protein K470DRAFT_266450 [Piedraia hortae CBS 480.64]|uniref:Uncharacterized protein n=1 Tax=Piedraia hortae CBS 480.64 TaxID=1314780 RepID=A0A6A7BTA7_9PEZI|nr:hypothetical protein K470DRAFT_266450 [Piedraia hortae CBS 480.64]
MPVIEGNAEEPLLLQVPGSWSAEGIAPVEGIVPTEDIASVGENQDKATRTSESSSSYSQEAEEAAEEVTHCMDVAQRGPEEGRWLKDNENDLSPSPTNVGPFLAEAGPSLSTNEGFGGETNWFPASPVAGVLQARKSMTFAISSQENGHETAPQRRSLSNESSTTPGRPLDPNALIRTPLLSEPSPSRSQSTKVVPARNGEPKANANGTALFRSASVDLRHPKDSPAKQMVNEAAANRDAQLRSDHPALRTQELCMAPTSQAEASMPKRDRFGLKRGVNTLKRHLFKGRDKAKEESEKAKSQQPPKPSSRTGRHPAQALAALGADSASTTRFQPRPVDTRVTGNEYGLNPSSIPTTPGAEASQKSRATSKTRTSSSRSISRANSADLSSVDGGPPELLPEFEFLGTEEDPYWAQHLLLEATKTTNTVKSSGEILEESERELAELSQRDRKDSKQDDPPHSSSSAAESTRPPRFRINEEGPLLQRSRPLPRRSHLNTGVGISAKTSSFR